MNLNEVIANLANESLGGGRGTYQPIGPKLASEFGSGTHQLEFVVVGQHGTSIVARSGSWAARRSGAVMRRGISIVMRSI